MEVEKINKKIGINVKAEKIAELLSIMCLQSVVEDDNKFIKVTIPPTRAGKNKLSLIIKHHYKLFQILASLKIIS